MTFLHQDSTTSGPDRFGSLAIELLKLPGELEPSTPGQQGADVAQESSATLIGSRGGCWNYLIMLVQNPFI